MGTIEIDGVPVSERPPVIWTILYCHKCKKIFKARKDTVRVDGKYVCPKCIEEMNK